MRDYPGVPEGWTVVGHRAAGPFTTDVTYQSPGGRSLEWSSRRHRKHASQISRVRPGHDGTLWAPHRASWWIAVLFSAGATCFLVAPLPVFLLAVGARADALVFFVGSVLFTVAATLQWLETINADSAPSSPDPVRRPLLLAWEPRRIDWWSSGVQLAGTLFFNASTFRALSTAVDSAAYNQVVWRPDAFGSICFLVSGYLAYVEVSGGLLRRQHATLEGVLVSVNLLGCLAFGVSAVAAYVVPSTGSPLDVAVANTATALGALAFLVGSILLLPEGSRSLPPATTVR